MITQARLFEARLCLFWGSLLRNALRFAPRKNPPLTPAGAISPSRGERKGAGLLAARFITKLNAPSSPSWGRVGEGVVGRSGRN